MGVADRSPSLGQFSAQLNDALYRQKSRLEIAWAVEQEAKRIKTKHPLEPESSAQAAKRAKLEVQAGSGKGKGVEVDISGWALDEVIEVVMAGLEVVDLELIKRAFEVRKSRAELIRTPKKISTICPLWRRCLKKKKKS